MKKTIRDNPERPATEQQLRQMSDFLDKVGVDDYFDEVQVSPDGVDDTGKKHLGSINAAFFRRGRGTQFVITEEVIKLAKDHVIIKLAKDAFERAEREAQPSSK